MLRTLGYGAAIVLALMIIYSPALHGGWVWDDGSWTRDIAPLLQDWRGLLKMWTSATALQQYYPLSGTTFWIDHQLWGDWTLPYHVENVLLHALAAVLFWRLLERLEVRGAWLAGAVFALHPMMVESVAWITERKNVLSMALMLASLHSYGSFAGWWKSHPRVSSRMWWSLSFVLCVAALLAKISAFVVAPTVLLIAWWKDGFTGVRKHRVPTLPFFVVTLGLGLLVSWVEKHHVGAEGHDFDADGIERLLIAGRVPWFYLRALVWPFGHCAIYPTWTLDRGSVWPWLIVAASLAVFGFILRKGSRSGVLAALFYLGALVPVLGFLNVYGMVFSPVADRWAYVPCLSLIALLCALIPTRRWQVVTAVLVLPVLAFSSWRHAADYRDADTFWSAVLERHPTCWIALHQSGLRAYEAGHNELALALYDKAIAARPGYAAARSNAGNACAQLGRLDDAERLQRQAIAIDPSLPAVRYNLGNTLLRMGRADEARAWFEQEVKAQPASVEALNNLGCLAVQRGEFEQALDWFARVLRIEPERADVLANQGVALQQLNRPREAIESYTKAFQANPALPAASGNLARLLATSDDASVRNPQRAIEVASRAVEATQRQSLEAWRTLALTQAESGRFDEAIASTNEAIRLAVEAASTALVEELQHELRSYTAHRTLREN